MDKYTAIKKLAVTSAELLEQVQFEDHEGKQDKIEPLLQEIVELAGMISADPQKLQDRLRRRH